MSATNGADRYTHAIKIAASRIGVSMGAYLFHLKNGQKYCWKCEAFHPRDNFGKDKSRSDGLLPFCRNSYLRRKQDRCTCCYHVRDQRMVKVCWQCIDELRTYRKEKQLQQKAEQTTRDFKRVTGRGRKKRHPAHTSLSLGRSKSFE